MAKLASPLTLVAGVTTVLGKISSGSQSRAFGKAQQAHNEIAANQAIATSQRSALEERRQAELLASRALAVAGGSAGDPTVMRVISDIEGEGAYRANVELYGGEEKARILKTEGAIAAARGKAKASKSYLEAGTSALATGVSIYGKKYKGTGKA